MKSEEAVRSRIAELHGQWRLAADRMEETDDRELVEVLERETVALNRLERELEWVMS